MIFCVHKEIKTLGQLTEVEPIASVFKQLYSFFSDSIFGNCWSYSLSWKQEREIQILYKPLRNLSRDLSVRLMHFI